MEHQIYKEWIPLAADEELTSHEMTEFKKHLAECPECQYEFEEQQSLKLFITNNIPAPPDELLLFEARQGLRNAIRAERSKESFLKKIAGKLGFFKSAKFGFALGGAALLAVGFFTGYLFFDKAPVYSPAMPDSQGLVQTASNEFSPAQSDVRISNVRFIDQDASDGEIEFLFDAVKPVRMKGNINDESIKNILTYSMLNVENPGVRLNSINAIGSEQKSDVGAEVKAAIISVAKFDENPGVRREAIMLLKKLNNDEEVKNALLYVLMNDQTSGNRIEAINSLIQAQKQGVKFNEDELSMFKEKMNLDENKYIRYQAKTVLMENN